MRHGRPAFELVTTRKTPPGSGSAILGHPRVCRLPQGGAQQAFHELCQGFERAGWKLEGRKFDWQFVNRGSLRWEVRIGVLGPGEKMHKGWGDPWP